MATSPDGNEFQRRYDGVEKAYCQQRWATVLETGSTLLRELSEAEDQRKVAGLRHRMQLLMAHTLLHGYGDREAAEDLYEMVRKSDAESSLRQIAEDGLDLCHQPLTSTFVAEEPEEGEGDAERAELFLPESEQAEPQEPPRERKRKDEETSFPPPEPEPEPEPEFALEEISPLSQRKAKPAVEAPTDPETASDPFNPSNDQAPKAAKKRKAIEMPWLTPLPEADDWDDEEEEENLPPVARGRRFSSPASPSTLIPDVVDEPELMEVHQADPSLAEEVEVPLRAGALPAATAREVLLTEDQDQDLRAGLLRVVVR